MRKSVLLFLIVMFCPFAPGEQMGRKDPKYITFQGDGISVRIYIRVIESVSHTKEYVFVRTASRVYKMKPPKNDEDGLFTTSFIDGQIERFISGGPDTFDTEKLIPLLVTMHDKTQPIMQRRIAGWLIWTNSFDIGVDEIQISN